jgi:hypothetical protein
MEDPEKAAGQKPEASKATINEINNGVGYVNYFGHGGADQWAQKKFCRMWMPRSDCK